jgi:hypothetical protein
VTLRIRRLRHPYRMKEKLVGEFLCGATFETPAFGGLLRMRPCFATKSQTLWWGAPLGTRLEPCGRVRDRGKCDCPAACGEMEKHYPQILANTSSTGTGGSTLKV